MIETIHTDYAPKAIGPYAQAVRAGEIVYTSGQIGLRPDGMLVGETVDAQTRQVLANLRHVLEAAGARMDTVIKTTIYLTDLDDFETINAIYAEAFGLHRPARSTVEVSRLPRDAKVEIDCIARIDA